jgi:hypothetical protein
MEEQGIELTEFLSALRIDLQCSSAESASENLRFAIDDIEVELNIKASRSGENAGRGKLTFWVFEVGGEKKSGTSAERTQRVKLKLKPVWKGDPKYALLVADEVTKEPKDL